MGADDVLPLCMADLSPGPADHRIGGHRILPIFRLPGTVGALWKKSGVGSAGDHRRRPPLAEHPDHRQDLGVPMGWGDPYDPMDHRERVDAPPGGIYIYAIRQ